MRSIPSFKTSLSHTSPPTDSAPPPIPPPRATVPAPESSSMMRRSSWSPAALHAAVPSGPRALPLSHTRKRTPCTRYQRHEIDGSANVTESAGGDGPNGAPTGESSGIRSRRLARFPLRPPQPGTRPIPALLHLSHALYIEGQVSDPRHAVHGSVRKGGPGGRARAR